LIQSTFQADSTVSCACGTPVREPVPPVSHRPTNHGRGRHAKPSSRSIVMIAV
jgi:hypothetical protein